VTFSPSEIEQVLAELRVCRRESLGLRLRNLPERLFRRERPSPADFQGVLQNQLQHIVTFERLLRLQRVVIKLLSLLRLEGD